MGSRQVRMSVSKNWELVLKIIVEVFTQIYLTEQTKFNI